MRLHRCNPRVTLREETKSCIVSGKFMFSGPYYLLCNNNMNICCCPVWNQSGTFVSVLQYYHSNVIECKFMTKSELVTDTGNLTDSCHRALHPLDQECGCRCPQTFSDTLCKWACKLSTTWHQASISPVLLHQLLFFSWSDHTMYWSRSSNR